ncbi:hypothetical protein FACS1894105_00160 [Clostridia bacterium]|nr:hypothetical protein FACS1894105_00160 [Clostridia bacterium]
MKRQKRWSRLDNAAKIFPPTSGKNDTKVFRFSCELYEIVEENALQTALDRTLERFPIFRSVLKRGFFWYYLEDSDIKPLVRQEYRRPCPLIYSGDSKELLFEVTYYKKRINFEVYHALTDGSGALQFIRTLAFHYLTEKHCGNTATRPVLTDYDASAEQKRLDSFSKYYTKNKAKQKNKRIKAFKIRGELFPDHKLSIIEGKLPLSAVLSKSRELGATVSEFLSAILIHSIHEVMPLNDENKPVAISIPVNLRKYFPSESARNFFGIVNICHNFKTQGQSFEDVLLSVKSSFSEQLTIDKIKERMNELAAFEHNLAINIVPLFIKNLALKIANAYSEAEVTAAFSNIGRVTMPDEIANYIHAFDLFSSTKRLQICLCSYGDTLMLSFTSPFISTDVQCHFFRKLTSCGIEAVIHSNQLKS